MTSTVERLHEAWRDYERRREERTAPTLDDWLPTVAGCTECLLPLSRTGAEWFDEFGSSVCPGSGVPMCDRLCRPHLDAPEEVRCGLCLGTGRALWEHAPDLAAAFRKALAS